MGQITERKIRHAAAAAAEKGERKTRKKEGKEGKEGRKEDSRKEEGNEEEEEEVEANAAAASVILKRSLLSTDLPQHERAINRTANGESITAENSHTPTRISNLVQEQ